MNFVNKKMLKRFEENTDLIDIHKWKKIEFWQRIFLYFWFLSVIGQLYEVFFWGEDTTTIIPFAQPYGLGAVAVIMFVFPLIRKKLVSPSVGYLLNVLITGAVEYLCSVVVVLFYGKNYFWNYDGYFLNINGQVCLGSAMLFGLLATIFIYSVYPMTEKILNRQNKLVLNIVFCSTLFIFVFDTVYSILLR